jgi:hypothetical protein
MVDILKYGYVGHICNTCNMPGTLTAGSPALKMYSLKPVVLRTVDDVTALPHSCHAATP